MTPEQLKSIWRTQPGKLTRALHVTLVDFGYRDLQTETVQKSIERYYAGEKSAGVIDGFVHGWLQNGIN